jgi:hypothetical protein
VTGKANASLHATDDGQASGQRGLRRFPHGVGIRRLALDADLLERLEGAPEPRASLKRAIEAVGEEELASMLPAPSDR